MQNAIGSTRQTAYALVEQAYCSMRMQVRAYIYNRINDADEADDLTQDVFLRLLEYGQTIHAVTVRQMVFTVARNLVFDYLRRKYCHQEVHEEIAWTSELSSSHSESLVVAADLLRLEQRRVALLPAQRQRIYRMVRYEGKSVAEISDRLQLSVRTVENHLAIGRREVREYLRRCI